MFSHFLFSNGNTSTVTGSKLTTQPGKESETSVGARNRTSFRELADPEDGRLMSQNNHVVRVWMSGYLLDWRQGEVRKQCKKAINLASISKNGKPQAGDMLISSFLPSTGGQGPEQGHFGSTVRQRSRIL